MRAERDFTPGWLKWAFTGFMAVLVPVYWHHYGPTNFLYFCDVALFATLAGIWLRQALLVSMAAVGILVPQFLWLLDFGVGLAGGHLVGLTDYMFDETRPLYLRGLSLFHGWLPLMLVYLVWRAGYDTRALKAWTATAWVLVMVCFLFMPPPSADHGMTPANINYVYGFEDEKPQTLVPQWLWLTLELAALPLLLFWPTHWALKKLDARRRAPWQTPALETA